VTTLTAFGPGVVAALPRTVIGLAERMNVRARALVVTGSTADRHAGVQHLIDELIVGRHRHPADGPTSTTVEALAQHARAERATAIVAIGGGRVLDAAKAAARLLRGTAGSATQAAVVAVPTTPGTGAEVTPFATVWDRDRGRKQSVVGPGVRPAAAIVDPDLCAGLPPAVLTASLLDALAQGAEAAWSTHSTPESIGHGLTAVALAARSAASTDDLWNPPLEARIAASLAGLESGRAITAAQTTACHAISYPLSLRHGLAHGSAVGLTFGPLLEYNGDVGTGDCADPRGPAHVRRIVARIAEALGARDAAGGRGVVERLRRRGGLADYGQLGADSAALAAEAAGYERLAHNPRVLDRERVEALLRSLATPVPIPAC
jgi:alcohol dehydrogenase class IV